MNLANLFVELISFSNLAIFVNCLITDGNYQTAFLLYDDASIKNVHFISELTEISNQNYAITMMRFEGMEQDFNMEPFEEFKNTIQIVLVNSEQLSGNQLTQHFYRKSRVSVILLPKQDDIQKRGMLKTVPYIWFGESCAVIFYQLPVSPTSTAFSKSIEVYVNSRASLAKERIVHIDGNIDIHDHLQVEETCINRYSKNRRDQLYCISLIPRQ